MLRAAGGYISNIDWDRQFERMNINSGFGFDCITQHGSNICGLMDSLLPRPLFKLISMQWTYRPMVEAQNLLLQKPKDPKIQTKPRFTPAVDQAGWTAKMSGPRSSDSEEIDRRMTAEERALRLAFETVGLQVNQVLTHIPWTFRGMDRVTVNITHMKKKRWQRTKRQVEQGRIMDQPLCLSGTTAATITTNMSAEGRTRMNASEMARLIPELGTLPEYSDDDLHAAGSSSDVVSASALAAAPTGPWHLPEVPSATAMASTRMSSSTSANAKPKVNRKCEPHFAIALSRLRVLSSLLCAFLLSPLGLGVGGLIGKSSDLRPSSGNRASDPVDRGMPCADNHHCIERPIEKAICTVSQFVSFALHYVLAIIAHNTLCLLQYCNTRQNAWLARYNVMGPNIEGHQDSRISATAGPAPTRYIKRSYKRAYARAQRTQALPRNKATIKTTKAWKVIRWNSSGLTTSVYQELETYLRQERVDIAFIQESKWRFESTWETAEFLYIHSCGTGPVDKVGGVLTIVSKRLAKASDLQFQVLHGGRLLHVRVPSGGVHVDLLNYYQYAVVQEDVVYERRQNMFFKLQKCLAGLPRRNSLILAGDFNCPFIPFGNVCGTHVISPSADHYRDLQDQQNIAKSLKLTALNTWQRPPHGQGAMFTAFSDRSAQIDFIVVRSRQATTTSRQAAVLPDFPVAAWREGPKHHPVQAWVALPPPTWIKDRPSTFEPKQIDKEAIIQDLKQEVTDQLTGIPGDLNKILLQAALQHYPLRRVGKGATQPMELANQAKDMWQKFRAMRANRFSMAGIVPAWRQWAEIQQAHALHKARSKQRSKQKRLDIVQSAQQAADEGNAYKVWQAVRRLVPRAPKKQLQLHKDGKILSFDEELQWIVTAYGDRFGAKAEIDCPQVQVSDRGGLHIDPAEIAWQLARLNPRKAVPRCTAPAVVFKASSNIIAAPVAEHFNETWAQEDPQVDQDWADAEVALLPKAHGRSATPLDWRPIGLQDPLGKCVMGLVVAQAREAIVRLVRQYPQCAYLPGRSTHTALRKVFQHCHGVREDCSKARRTIHDQHAGAAPVGCSGGLQISVDLSAAFDVVHWDHLKESLDLAGVNLLVQEVILQWLRQVRYLFRHRGKQGIVVPKWGLRQGCKASPCLWAAYTALLCVNINSQLGGDWVKDHLTKYADDSHLRWRFQSFEQFEAIMQEVCQVFVCFRKFHMKINLEKSKAILKMVGTLKHKVRKDFIRKTNAGHRLLLSPRNPDKWLTLVQSTEYLGAIVSYQQFELQTLRHRISKANARRWALASFLHSRRISVKLKLRIWQSSVLSSLLYGLSTCGLTGGQVEDVQRVIMKHVRAIISNQAHLTGDKHEVIIRRYHIPLAADLLQAELHRASAAQDQHADWMYEAEWQMRMHGIVDEQATFDKTLHSSAVSPLRVPPVTFVMFGQRSAEPVPAFDELEDFFGEVKAEGQATNKRRKPEPDRPFRSSGQLGRADPLVLSLARAVVRQEEELKVLKQDHSIVMWLRPGEYGILHHLYVTAKAFKQKQQENPMWAPGQQPLRIVMAIALFREMEVRVNKVLADETLQKKAADMGWRDPATGWRYQRWNPSLKHLEADSSRNPLTDQQVLQAFKMLYTSLDQDTVTRFSCTRKVTETMANQATFLMDISVRTPAAMEAWKTMHMLQGCSVLQLGGMAYRRDTLKCSPLVEKIKEMLRALLAFHRDPDRLASLGRCAQFLNGLKNGSFEKSHNLLNNFLWRLLLRGWTDVQRQHDVIEFAAHIKNKHELVLFQGQWETRKTFDGVPSAIEMGLTTQPLQLYMPELPPGLDAALSVQRLMDHWMHHDGVSALTVAPSVLLLQIDRFQNVRGRISKRMEAVNIGGKLRVPLFTGIGLGIRIIPYRLTAYITHFGMHPQSGHYVCTLVQETVHWRCDDERTAVQGSALSFEHASNVYMLIYEQTDLASHDV
ncbi:unnamed protein product [Symbiodinium sp. CCMP2592]|nr:unnamed protein product [Symbiodinium sp. CCMP2592]